MAESYPKLSRWQRIKSVAGHMLRDSTIFTTSPAPQSTFSPYALAVTNMRSQVARAIELQQIDAHLDAVAEQPHHYE